MIPRVANLTDDGHSAIDLRHTPHVVVVTYAGATVDPRRIRNAVGVLLFELLTGRSPWGEPEVTDLTRIKAAGVELDLAAIAPEIPRGWADLIRECMRTDPLLRPPDARALVVHLTTLRGETDQPAIRRMSALATAQGPKWIEVLPFTADDPNGSGAWVKADVKDALAQIRGLRVAEAGAGASTRLLQPITKVRGSVRPVDDGVVVEIHVVDEAGESCGEFHAVVDHNLDPRLRGLVLTRWTLGRAEPAGLQALDDLLAATPRDVPVAMLAECRDIVALQRAAPDAREQVFRRLEVAHAGHTLARTAGAFAQVLCELACVFAEPARARQWLAVADQHALVDRQWLEHNPNLVALRGDLTYPAIHARVLARTDAVAEAIWG